MKSEKYETFREQGCNEYGRQPAGGQAEELYAQALELQESSQQDRDILRLIGEEKSDSKAFFCSFSTFRSLVSLERRCMKRSGQPASLLLVCLGEDTPPAKDRKRLERIFLERLGAGDPIASLGPGTYIIMLTGADGEAARLAFGRIDSAFHDADPHSEEKLTFQVADLGTLE